MSDDKKNIMSIDDLIKCISEIKIEDDTLLFFRGETKDRKKTALVPGIYRNDYIKNEEIIYREMQRFNEKEFNSDRTAFDKLSRMQHYTAPTRLLDISEDLLGALYFAIAEKDVSEEDGEDAIIYVLEIKKSSIKYYDSDAVSVISNLVKIPLSNTNNKSKNRLLCDANTGSIKKFNQKKSAKFLRHEIREEKAQFEAIINPRHITSIQCVHAKLTSDRIRSQKGLFLLFGLNPKDAEKSIQLLGGENFDKLKKSEKELWHPIEKLHKIEIDYSSIKEMKKNLKKIGITKPFIYPEIDKVSEYIKEEYKNAQK